MKMIADNQKGVSLIITFFIMIIILAVVLSVSVILYSEVKVIRNIGNSMASLYAADSGIEKVLYYDNQVVPTLADGITPAVRGLCSMYPYNSATNSAACPGSSTDVANLDSSIYCAPDTSLNSGKPESLATDGHDGCDPASCDDCKIAFRTTLDNGANYYTTATVTPTADGQFTDFQIVSKGDFGSASRQLKVLISAAQLQSAIRIENACANPKSAEQGVQEVDISAKISAVISGQDTIDSGSTVATVRDSSGNYYDGSGNIVSTTGLACASAADCASSKVCDNNLCVPALHLTLTSGSFTSGTWEYCPTVGNCGWVTSASPNAFYVDIIAQDTQKIPNKQECYNLSPIPYCYEICK